MYHSERNMCENKFTHLLKKYTDNEGLIGEFWDEIKSQYSSKSRHYHTLVHLHNMFQELEQVKSEVQNLDVLEFSIFYHDIVYKASRSDNEQQSAELFKKRLSKTSFPFIQNCENQILATKKHLTSSDHDTNILLDLDLSILGHSQELYTQYAADIREEYKVYPDFLYNKGRIKVLNHLLGLDSIYKTNHFIASYERQARRNLLIELNKLVG